MWLYVPVCISHHFVSLSTRHGRSALWKVSFVWHVAVSLELCGGCGYWRGCVVSAAAPPPVGGRPAWVTDEQKVGPPCRVMHPTRGRRRGIVITGRHVPLPTVQRRRRASSQSPTVILRARKWRAGVCGWSDMGRPLIAGSQANAVMHFFVWGGQAGCVNGDKRTVWMATLPRPVILC